MVPMSTWVLEREAWSDALARAKEHWHKPGFAVDYMPPESTWNMFCEMANKSQSIVVVDASAFDTCVRAEENAYLVDSLIPDYEYSELLKQYYNTAEILTPDGLIERNGGMLSGVLPTNLGDSIFNVADLATSFGPLARYLIGYHVRGDDIILYFDTAIRQQNISAMGRQSFRTINPDKSDIRTNSAWFAKLYLDPDLHGYTKPIFLVLNSLMFKERESDAITSSKYYASIAATSIIASLEHHPWGDEVRQEYWASADKYPIRSLERSGLTEAMSAYQSSHSWMVEHGILDSDASRAVENLRSSWAAEE
jgi:hypothetical protein